MPYGSAGISGFFGIACVLETERCRRVAAHPQRLGSDDKRYTDMPTESFVFQAVCPETWPRIWSKRKSISPACQSRYYGRIGISVIQYFHLSTTYLYYCSMMSAPLASHQSGIVQPQAPPILSTPLLPPFRLCQPPAPFPCQTDVLPDLLTTRAFSNFAGWTGKPVGMKFKIISCESFAFIGPHRSTNKYSTVLTVSAYVHRRIL